MPITKPTLPPKDGYVEVEIDGIRTYKNVNTGILIENEGKKTLEEAKTEKILKSKENLTSYLETHPFQWTDGNYYSITAEKQSQLTSKIMAATMAQTLSQPYTLTWNSTGKICQEWTLTNLSALAFAIDQRVTSLVSYQQTQEVAIRNAKTQEALDAIIIDYDSVSVNDETTE